MTALSRFGTDSTAARNYSCGTFAHSQDRDVFRYSILLWEVEHAFASNIDHNEYSIGLRSGLEGGHSSLEKKSGIFSFNHFWLNFAVWAGAPSCWTKMDDH
eukprot:TRINITY_DN1162_c0_g1_i6.p2 TRINITY_DN1162_c0_g1~~TRINITY_DN1162_c0_g1_i6.p2  ORF type:complete len:101 (-),score=0.96 TRINITY_DN1162_c0_g1_i6:294-596(-)